MAPTNDFRKSDRTEGLLLRRIRQLQSLRHVFGHVDPVKRGIARAMAAKLCAAVGCPEVPPSTAHAIGPLMIRKALQDAQWQLQEYREARGCRWRDRWHA